MKIEKITWTNNGKLKVWHMRISETVVVQLVESDPPLIVVVQDPTGWELKIRADQVKPFLLGRFHSDTLEFKQVLSVVGEDNLDKFLDALAYFEQFT